MLMRTARGGRPETEPKCFSAPVPVHKKRLTAHNTVYAGKYINIARVRVRVCVFKTFFIFTPRRIRLSIVRYIIYYSTSEIDRLESVNWVMAWLNLKNTNGDILTQSLN